MKKLSTSNYYFVSTNSVVKQIVVFFFLFIKRELPLRACQSDVKKQAGLELLVFIGPVCLGLFSRTWIGQNEWNID